MSQDLAQIQRQTVAAVRRAAAALNATEDRDKLYGFALCTDDDVRTLYHIACRQSWVSEQEADYPDIGYIAVEWTLSDEDTPFLAVSAQLAALADQVCSSREEWLTEADKRFEALVLALQECRQAGDFLPETLLCVESTDPSEHHQALAMRAVIRLNEPDLAAKYATALGRSELQ